MNSTLQPVIISNIKSREEVLGSLLLKIFGIICERGQTMEDFPGCTVRLGGNLDLTGSLLGPDRIILSVYWPVKSFTKKVFSAHVTDLPSAGDQNCYRYQGGRVGLLSWRRGEWEDAILAQAAVPTLSFRGVFARNVSDATDSIIRNSPLRVLRKNGNSDSRNDRSGILPVCRLIQKCCR